MSAARVSTIEDLGLRTRTRRVLLAAEIRRLPDLLSIPLLKGKSVFKIPGQSHLRALPEVGPQMEREVLAALSRAGLRLAAPRRPFGECGCPSCAVVFGPLAAWRDVYKRLKAVPAENRVTPKEAGA